MTGSTGSAGSLKVERCFEVERFHHAELYTVSSRVAGPFWGGKVRLPQRPRSLPNRQPVASAEQTSAAPNLHHSAAICAFIRVICVNRLTWDPVLRGGKVRLPQRPEVSSQTGNLLPLPNRLRQPLKYLRELLRSLIKNGLHGEGRPRRTALYSLQCSRKQVRPALAEARPV